MSFRSRAPLTVLLVVALAVGAGACGEDDPTPEEARRQRVEERLKLSYTDEQVDCMLEQLSEGVLTSLDGKGNMPQGGAELEEFSTVARACVIGSGDTIPGTPDTGKTTTSATTSPETSTSAPPADDSSGGSTPGGSSPGTTAGAAGGPDTRPETQAPTDGAEGDDQGEADDEAGTDQATAGRAG